MKRHDFRLAIVMLVLSLFLSPILSAGLTGKEVSYPEGYRQWSHVKSMVIEKGHPLYDSFGGIHHVYANKTALEAMEDNRAFPDGAVIVFDLLEAESGGNAITEGKRKLALWKRMRRGSLIRMDGDLKHLTETVKNGL
jgi:hypothetical protein